MPTRVGSIRRGESRRFPTDGVRWLRHDDTEEFVRGADTMLKWALIFFIISLLAGVFGFTGIASGAAAVAKILFYIAVALFVLFLVLGLIALKAVK
jgi:uncharacterized membrane protein YtjA (UPF0391 family)